MEIKEALGQLDTFDDDQWTQEGAPRTDVVGELVGEKVTRQQIIDAAPKFTRSNPVIDGLETKEDENAVQEEERPQEVSGTPIIDRYLAEGPMQPQEFLELLRKLPENQLAVMENVLVRQQQEIEKKESDLAELKRLVKLALANTRADIKNKVPDMDNMEAIQHFIKSQTASRKERAEFTRQVLGGLTPGDLARLDPRAPIDRAMARKNPRGTARPVR